MPPASFIAGAFCPSMGMTVCHIDGMIVVHDGCLPYPWDDCNVDKTLVIRYNTLNVLYDKKAIWRKVFYMVEKKNILTYAGLRQLEEELHDLKVYKRKEVAQKIKEAREQGDLSENAEYDAAKDEQRDVEARIEEIDKILKNAEVVVEDEVDVNVINIGCKVKIFDMEFKEELEYKIVGSTEANSLKGKISNESPLGMALLGRHVGDVVDVATHTGIIQYEILEIQKSN